MDGDDAADAKVESEVRDPLSVDSWKLIHNRQCGNSICACDGRIGSWWNMDNMSGIYLLEISVKRIVERIVQLTEETTTFTS